MLNKSLGNYWGIIGDSLKEDSLKSVAGGLGRISKENAIILGAAIGAVVGFCTAMGANYLLDMAYARMRSFNVKHGYNIDTYRIYHFGSNGLFLGITSSFGLAGGKIAKHLWQLYDKKSKKSEMKKID